MSHQMRSAMSPGISGTDWKPNKAREHLHLCSSSAVVCTLSEEERVKIVIKFVKCRKTFQHELDENTNFLLVQNNLPKHNKLQAICLEQRHSTRHLKPLSLF